MQRASPMQDECTYNNPKFNLIKLDQPSVRDASCATGLWTIFGCSAGLWQVVFVASS